MGLMALWICIAGYIVYLISSAATVKWKVVTESLRGHLR